MCMETYVQTYYNASFHPNPNAREASEKACQPHHDKKFLMGELQFLLAAHFQQPCKCSSEISLFSALDINLV